MESDTPSAYHEPVAGIMWVGEQIGSQLRDLPSQLASDPNPRSTFPSPEARPMPDPSAPPDRRPQAGRPGAALTLWVTLLVATHALAWLLGGRAPALARAIEQGEARVEVQASASDLSPDGVRKLIQLQRDTRPFWLTLALLGDFALDPAALIVRPLLVATLLAAWAALAGRPSGFDAAVLASSRLQGLWVLGPALALVLTLARPGSTPGDTSLALFLPAGPHSAWLWATLQGLDVFALIGWLALAGSAAARRQVSLPTALVSILPLLIVEVAVRAAGAALLGAGMRLTIVPG